MKWSMLNKFAISNLSKNSRLYIPSIIAGSGLLAVFYVLLTLATDPNMKNIRGGDYLHPFLILGVVMMCFLSMVLIFYTICLCGTFLVFALIYIIIYSMTAKVYYQIVH